MSEIKFKTEWLTQIALLANCGTPDDVADLCCAIQRASQGLPVNEMSPLTETLFAPIAESIEADRHLSQVRSEARTKNNKTATKSDKTATKTDKEERETEKEKDQKKEITEKEESTDASVANTYSNIASVLAPSLSCSELVETTSEPPLITLPLNNGTEWPVTSEMVSEWSALYPAVDIMQELRKMRGWCCAKPKNRKTPRGIQAFITNWLSKEQDRGGSRASPVRPPAQRRLTPIEVYNLPAINPWSEEGS